MNTLIINKLPYTMTVMSFCLAAIALFSCSDDKIVGDPAKDWNSSEERYTPVDENAFLTYFKPALGRVGDPMPFYDQKAGNFKVMYLQDYDDNAKYCFHPYWGVQTTDGCNYQSIGEVLAVGSNDYQQDAALGTGCCYYNESEGLYYIYYTGENPDCKDRQVVMRATSTDFKTWTRDKLWQLHGPDYGYSAWDFRDPQIFVADDGLYHMVISTAPSYGGDPKFADFKSADMKNWEHVGQFNMVWERMCECPDVFKMGDWWYLVFSEGQAVNWSRKMKYVKAKSWEELKACLNDPKVWPDYKEGVLDSRGFYAGKTASNGTDRYIWGWCPYRSGADIDAKNVNVGAGGEPNWGGALVCHKIIQHEDGTISLGEVPAMAAKYNKQQNLQVVASNGYDNSQLTGEGAYVMFNRLGYHNHISMTVKTEGDADRFGISLVRSANAKKYYTMMVNPEADGAKRKVNFEQEGEEGKGFIEAIDGYEVPRPEDNTYQIDIYTDNSVCVMYINDNVCYTNRIYGIQNNNWSINSYGGAVTVSNVKVTQY
ncbi:MAG: DUF4975 domain-containing protein [Prevotella sp.]|nr:DUF4975 domain-containing protein [Prevotella sp.]